MKYITMVAIVGTFFIYNNTVSMEQSDIQKIREQRLAQEEKRSKSEQTAQEQKHNDVNTIGSDAFNA